MNLNELQYQVNLGASFKYIFFWGHTSDKSYIHSTCLSQWYPSPFEVDGYVYKTAEHFMMAEKARLFGDEEVFETILTLEHPGDAKKWGRKVRGFKEDVWKQYRSLIVEQGNLAKFRQHEELKQYLLQTQEAVLVEASPYDRIWGIGLRKDAHNVTNPNSWKGLNLLGFALMKVRKWIQEDEARQVELT